MKFFLSPEDKLVPAWPEANTFDSSIEESFASKWGSERRDGWLLKREDEILWKNQEVFIPDFSFTHEDGRRVLLEIAGFWTEDYITQKKATLAKFKDTEIIVAVPESAREAYEEIGRKVILYKANLLLQPVLAILKCIL